MAHTTTTTTAAVIGQRSKLRMFGPADRQRLRHDGRSYHDMGSYWDASAVRWARRWYRSLRRYMGPALARMAVVQMLDAGRMQGWRDHGVGAQ